MKITSAAAIGGGVIGGAWCARFVLNGIDCKIFDPHPDAPRSKQNSHLKTPILWLPKSGQTNILRRWMISV